jgi:hypothetical protein
MAGWALPLTVSLLGTITSLSKQRWLSSRRRHYSRRLDLDRKAKSQAVESISKKVWHSSLTERENPVSPYVLNQDSWLVSQALSSFRPGNGLVNRYLVPSAWSSSKILITSARYHVIIFFINAASINGLEKQSRQPSVRSAGPSLSIRQSGPDLPDQSSQHITKRQA